MQTKQSKFPIGWVFAIMAAIAVGVLTFFSFNFQELGQKVGVSFLYALLVALIPLAVVGGLVWAKKVSMPINFKKAASIEACLLISYLVLIVISAIMINHFYVVMSKKDIIKSEVTAQVNQIDDMYKEYDDNVRKRTEAYTGELQQYAAYKTPNYYLEKLDQHSIDDVVIKNLTSKIDYNRTKYYQDVQAWKDNMLSKTKGLGLITLMPRIKEIRTNLETTLNTLQTFDKRSEKGLNGPHWTYTLSVSEDILQNYKKADDESLNVWSLIVAILAGLIMLLPYIAADRDGRHKGLFWELSHTRETKPTDDDIVTGI